jgi:hypothetical protein
VKGRHALIVGIALGGVAILAAGGIAGSRQVIELAGGAAQPTASPPTTPPTVATASPDSATPTPTASAANPGPRVGAVMVYDPENHGVILFSGSTTVPQPDGTNLAVSLGDTWLWDGRSWKQLDVTGPPARSAAMAAYDSVRHEVVLFGGSGPGGVGPGLYFNDTWAWDGSRWRLLEPAHKPDPRMRAAIAFDQARAEAVMVGGEGAKTYISTWTWDGTDWALRDPATNPTARMLAGMAYSASTRTTVLYGGTWAGRHLNDTWIWDGSNWRRGPAGPAAGWTSLIHDDALHEIVGLVYTPSATASVAVITWNGVAWSNVTSKGPRLGPRAQASMTYDEAHSEVVLYGGHYTDPVPYAEMWVWRGAGWSLWEPSVGA